jgi:hypothetical protein
VKIIIAPGVEAVFTVTVYQKCSVNSFVLNPTGDQTFAISPTATATSALPIPASTFSSDPTAGCPLEFSVEIYNYALLTWTRITSANAPSFISSDPADDLSSNAFSVQTTDFAAWANSVQLLRMHVVDPNSSVAGGKQYDQFTLTISYVCYDDELTIAT